VVSLFLAGGANTEATDQVRRSEGDGAQGKMMYCGILKMILFEC